MIIDKNDSGVNNKEFTWDDLVKKWSKSKSFVMLQENCLILNLLDAWVWVYDFGTIDIDGVDIKRNLSPKSMDYFLTVLMSV